MLSPLSSYLTQVQGTTKHFTYQRTSQKCRRIHDFVDCAYQTGTSTSKQNRFWHRSLRATSVHSRRPPWASSYKTKPLTYSVRRTLEIIIHLLRKMYCDNALGFKHRLKAGRRTMLSLLFIFSVNNYIDGRSATPPSSSL